MPIFLHHHYQQNAISVCSFAAKVFKFRLQQPHNAKNHHYALGKKPLI